MKTATFESARVLVVDDDAFMRVFLRDALESLGHVVSEASDGEEALVAAEALQPRLVLLDLLMPRRSGLDVLPLLRHKSPRSRILVVSSLDSQALIVQAIQAGACDVVTKPFHPTELAQALQRALTQAP